MNDINYVIGRLQGLNELVKILKDVVSKKSNQNAEIIAVITDHISEQLDSILSEFENMDVKKKQKQVLMELKEKHAPAEEAAPEPAPEPKAEAAAPAEKLEKHGKTVDDLLKELETLKS